MAPRRPKDPWDAAEAVFRPAPPPPPAASPKAATASSGAVPGPKEQVTLRLDQDVLEAFQADGPGWQDRINVALRAAAGL